MMSEEEVINVAMEEGQIQAGSVVNAVMTHGDRTDLNANGVLSTASASAAESVEAFLIMSLKNLREENKRLTEEYGQLKDCCEIKIKEKLNNLNMMNMPSNSDDMSLLKVIHVKQLSVIDKLKNLIDTENQLEQAYDEHCKVAIKHSEKNHQVDKQERGYDQFTTMSHVELIDMLSSIKQNIISNESEAVRLTSQVKSEEERHNAELDSLKKDMNTLEDALRDASEIVQDLHFEVTQRRRGSR